MFLFNYNIPPWMSFKKDHLMLVLLVPRNRRVKKMDMYLVPLIDELQLFWNDIIMYRVSRPLNSNGHEFTLYEMICWCTHDIQYLFLCYALVRIVILGKIYKENL